METQLVDSHLHQSHHLIMADWLFEAEVCFWASRFIMLCSCANNWLILCQMILWSSNKTPPIIFCRPLSTHLSQTKTIPAAQWQFANHIAALHTCMHCNVFYRCFFRGLYLIEAWLWATSMRPDRWAKISAIPLWQVLNSARCEWSKMCRGCALPSPARIPWPRSGLPPTKYWLLIINSLLFPCLDKDHNGRAYSSRTSWFSFLIT